MKRVVVVTDSNATVPEGLVQELDIRVVPVLLHLDGHTFRDGVDLPRDEFYRLLRTHRHTPRTSAPSVGDFLRVFASAADEAQGIVAIHLPPQLSAVYNNALLASELVDGLPIRVVSSQTAAMAQGFVVLEAARAAAAGADLDAVAARAEEMSKRVRLLATLETLEYLHRGGRIGGAAALVGSALRIMPILHLVNARAEPLTIARTRKKAVDCMLREMRKHVGDRPVHVAVCHGDAHEEAEALRQQVAEQFNCVELYVTEFTPVMGAHAGPGLLGLAFYAD